MKKDSTTSMLSFINALRRDWPLVYTLSKREIAGRYKGSWLGWGWPLITPLLMLTVYTFVFSQVFKTEWPGIDGLGGWGFALNLFAGLTAFNLFSECTTRAPNLILENPNYVTRVIFPLEALGWTNVIAAVVHAFLSIAILGITQAAVLQRLPSTILLIPLVWLPLLLLCLGLSWLLSAIGVFVRDIQQIIAPLISMTLFLSAVFYPPSSIPSGIRPILEMNPLISIIEQTRAVSVVGAMPSTGYLAIGITGGMIFCECSYRIFQRCKTGFADVM